MESTSLTSAAIYTDGSCHTQYKVGAWVAILLFTGERSSGEQHRQLLSGTVSDTTHNRMELTAVIKALEYIRENHQEITTLTICSDSQYVIGLPAREEKMAGNGFTGKKGKELPNADLVKKLLGYSRSFILEFVKIKAHQKKNGVLNYNIEADLLSRKLVRAAVIPYTTGLS